MQGPFLICGSLELLIWYSICVRGVRAAMATTRPQRAAQARKPLSQSSLSHSLQLHVGCVNLIFSFCPHWSTSELKKEKAVICMTLSLARKWCFLTIDAGTRCWRQGCSERECLFCMHCHPSASSECFFVRFDSGGCATSL